jgi:hypothetical protein
MRDVPIHTNCWVVRLEKASGESGYYCFHDMKGEINVSAKKSGMVQRFASRRDAERCIRELVKVNGLDIEEATPEEIVHDKTYSLWLGDTEWPDGISVEQSENGKRYLLIRDDGEEITTEDLGDNAADALVRVLDKIRKALTQKKS